MLRSRRWSACWRAKPRATTCIGWLTAMPETPPMKNERQPPSPKLHLIDEVATILRVSTKTVRRLIDKRELTPCRFGRSVRVHPDDLAAYIDRQRGL
jgi:excisionase family DNA binding protein